MALLLRKDVQKASYYVWFLGAEESRALRGTRILLSAIPYIVDRSQEIDPIKVTLQVSHKGMKIVQVSTRQTNFYKMAFSFVFFQPLHSASLTIHKEIKWNNDDYTDEKRRKNKQK